MTSFWTWLLIGLVNILAIALAFTLQLIISSLVILAILSILSLILGVDLILAIQGFASQYQ